MLVVYLNLDTGCVGSWLAIKDLQPTDPVLKAGHPVSCSTLCVLCIVWCMFGWNVSIVEARCLGFFVFFLLLLGA